VAACGGGSDPRPRDAAASTAAAVPAPATTAAAEAPPLRRPPATIDARPGETRVEDGPFTDRVRITGLAIAPGPRPVVRGRIVGSVDVSELIVLELRADFYDAAGRFVGSGRRVFHDAHADAREGPLAFRIRASAPLPGAVSALLSIPQLVNE